MEQQQPPVDLFATPIRIDDTAKRHITALAQWAMIIVITAVIGYVITLIQAFIPSRTIIETEPDSEGFSSFMRMGGQSIAGAIFGIVIGLLINYFLYRFSVQSRKGLAISDIDELGGGFRNLKIYFIIVSIFMIIFFLFGLIGVLALM
ncbi:MAG TPA: hypothetical protein VFZ42_01085 [Chitinophagaceae bacterium]